jgi:hypothetical protein
LVIKDIFKNREKEIKWETEKFMKNSSL